MLYLVFLTSKESAQEDSTSRIYPAINRNTPEEAVECVRGLYEEKFPKASVEEIKVHKHDTPWSLLGKTEPLYTWYPWL